MFKIAKEITVNWPVKVNVPQNGGKYAEHSFTANFRILPKSEAEQLLGDEPDAALLERILIGWSGIADADGEPLAFSEEAKTAVLDIPFVRLAVIAAYIEAQNGRRVKN